MKGSFGLADKDGLPELLFGLTAYGPFDNTERPHPSLGYRTPEEVQRRGQDGGAAIGAPVDGEALGQRYTAAIATRELT